MKKLCYFIALVCAVALTSCESEKNVWTDSTKLWYAGEDGSNLYGFINADGKFVIAPKFTIASAFSSGWCKVTEDEKDHKFYFIDKNGKDANAPEYSWYASAFTNDYINFQEGEKFGKMDKNWKVTVEPEYAALSVTADNGLSFFQEKADGKYGYLNSKDGKIVLEAEYDAAANFAKGVAVVRQKKDDVWYYGLINEKGEFVIDYQKKPLQNLGEGRIAFKNSNDKWGVMDAKGNEIVSASFETIEAYTCGMALVEKNDKYGAINVKGEQVIPCSYAWAFGYYDDVMWVTKDDLSGYFKGEMNWMLIDKKGEQLLKLKDGEQVQVLAALGGIAGVDCTFWQFHNGLAMVDNVNDKYSRYINKKGETIYKWSYAKDDKAPAYVPTKEDMTKARHNAMMQTEFAPLFEDCEMR